MAKLDKLLQMEEAGDVSDPSPKVEPPHPETGTVKQMSSEKAQADENKKKQLRVLPSMQGDASWLDDPEGEEGWLDDPMEPEEGWLDDPEADEQLLNRAHPSDDGIQLMQIKKKQ